jgi:hypothetical protein
MDAYGLNFSPAAFPPTYRLDFKQDPDDAAKNRYVQRESITHMLKGMEITTMLEEQGPLTIIFGSCPDQPDGQMKSRRKTL